MSRMLGRRPGAIVVWGILGLAAVQFISFNFAPYPIARPEFVARLSEALGVNLVEVMDDRRQSQIRHSNPLPLQDWGQEWALSTIDRFEGKKAVYLNIIPDYVQLNGNTFELIARRMGSPVRPTTSRRWTVMGDVVVVDPKVAMYCQWYLLKSGYQGNILRDDESQKNYDRLVDFVEHSGKFSLMGSRQLPDRTTVFLYRQK